MAPAMPIAARAMLLGSGTIAVGANVAAEAVLPLITKPSVLCQSLGIRLDDELGSGLTRSDLAVAESQVGVAQEAVTDDVTCGTPVDQGRIAVAGGVVEADVSAETR